MNDKEKEFEELYRAYWNYVYKYAVGYPEDFKPDESIKQPYFAVYELSREEFKERIEEDGMSIKVNAGY